MLTQDQNIESYHILNAIFVMVSKGSVVFLHKALFFTNSNQIKILSLKNFQGTAHCFLLIFSFQGFP